MKTNYCIIATSKKPLISGIENYVLVQKDYEPIQPWTTCCCGIIRKFKSKKTAKIALGLVASIAPKYSTLRVVTEREAKAILRKQDTLIANKIEGGIC